ncbi:YciI family protein [Candidatus Nephthysia bennettiae]|uniref:YciI family protein n=1 Tax=Candidatus Nephthysia bennettiae TaxID=3127016 RepID=A0A934KA04_9BACT|nr:YciI family protein [Candidatus Dormibacteraeota bacterium]MBJ7611212.1 YciI family protein [Candidatus Dormibacteraeota bacterium]
MRFMMLVKATPESEADVLPSSELLAAMEKYNEELIKAGVMLAGEGLRSSSMGARITFSGDKRTVTDGPFTEAKELIAGYWLIQVKSREEALEWASRVPFEDGEIEVRQVFEASDFPSLPPETVERHQAAREELSERK